MKVTSAEFVKSAFERAHWIVDTRPQVAFLGRSNVGKSSLINSLLLRKGLARTSNTPGRTQSINFFLINDAFYFADLPGYGYAKVSKAMRSDWGSMAEEYLSDEPHLALCVQLVDMRHKPTALDIQLNEWLVHFQKPHVVAATKADKLSNNEMRKALSVIQKTFAQTRVISYSSHTGKGRDELWTEINSAVDNI
jgi:GTP-binding protein